MKRLDKYIGVIEDALMQYCQDCIGSDGYEDERAEVDKAWAFIKTLAQAAALSIEKGVKKKCK